MTEQKKLSEWVKTHPPKPPLTEDQIILIQKMNEYLKQSKNCSFDDWSLAQTVSQVDLFAKNLEIACQKLLETGADRKGITTILSRMIKMIESNLNNPLKGNKVVLAYLKSKINELPDFISYEPPAKKTKQTIPDDILTEFYKQYSDYFPDCTNSTDFVNHFKEGKELTIEKGYKEAICYYFRLIIKHYKGDHQDYKPIFGTAIQKQKDKKPPKDKLDLFEPFYNRVKKG